MAKTKTIRAQRYKELREMGYSAKEASKLKDKGNADFVERVIDKGGKNIKDIVARVAKEAGFKGDDVQKIVKGGKVKVSESFRKRKIVSVDHGRPPVKVGGRGLKYQDLRKADKQYLSRFTVVIRYEVKFKKTGVKEWRYVTITGRERIKKGEAIDTAKGYVRDGVAAGDTAYVMPNVGKPLYSTFEIDAAYERMD